ncbi:sensor histidine kinase [Eubacterium oxidoreducens]|uniref:histidine kinase n=1 Tax=Eubacterium oxidoreducens TaxID=1732 RepID=A0A1G6B5T6_EUBOX|nr:HAMP domain-containing sensor histidine kinase [Eubacterium oxidoreducens]SDB16020.1 Signal transduction histidine kinase [Eubacterium oxidoreducens]
MKRFQSVRRFFHSLRFRIIIIFLIFSVVPALVIESGIMKSYIKTSVANRTVSILTETKLLANQMASSDYFNNTSNELITTQINQMSTIYGGRIMVIDDSFRIVMDSYDIDAGKTIISEEVTKSLQGEETTKYDKEHRYIKITVPITDTEESDVIGVFTVSVSTDEFQNTADEMTGNIGIFEVIMVLLLVVLSAFASGMLVAPIRRVQKSMATIRAGVTGEKINVKGYIEAQEIAETVNHLMEQVDAMESSRQEFVSNVSHELKTPLTSMKVLADSLVGQEEVPNELYKEFMVDIADEIERENQIINDLLSLVKLDKSEGTMNIELVNINELLELIMKRLRPIAEKQNVELVLESFRPVSAQVDEVKLTLALSNLAENAIKYNNPEGFVHVSLNADHQYFYVKVEDSGIGIPQDSIDHIFERFYRVDKSHSKEIGGTGLGLAITKNAILMHNGAIRVHSEEGKGTTFIVRIPLNYVS